MSCELSEAKRGSRYFFKFLEMFKSILLSSFCLILIQESNCNKASAKNNLKKIEFDITSIDEKGLQGGTIVDYEFCIPKEEDKIAAIKSIEPTVIMPNMAKGRIGCGQDEQLCIVSTNSGDWKDKLSTIASLHYVKRIIKTYYE